MEKGLSVPHREAPLSGSSINEISIEHANWEVLLYGGGYSQEMQNRSATGAAEEANFQASVVEDGYLDSSWAPILALIKAPSAVPEDENFTPDKLSKSTNKHFIPSLSSPNGINLTSPVLNTPSTTSMNATTIRNVKEAEKLAMFNSGPQKYHSEMQSNIAGSAFLNGYLASYQQQDDNRFTQIHHDQLPNIYRPRYNLSSSPQTEAETASGVTSSTQFAPATPEQARRLESLHSSLSTNVVGDQGLSQDTAKQKCRVPSADDEDTEQQCHRLIEHLVETSTTVIGTQLEERHDSDKGVSQEFDLNKTPPQKTPKRRKHRPKVVTEGRPRRGRKPINQKVDSNGEKLDKRKYVRTNVPKTTNTPEADAAKETKHKMSRPVSRSCRKKLNFEEKKTRGQSQCKPDCPSVGGNQRSRPHLVTADSEEIGPSSGFLNASINALLRPGQNEQMMSNKEAGIEHLRHQNIHPLQTERVTSADERTPTAQPLLSTETEKGNITTCSIMQRATAGIQRADYCCVGAHQHIQAGGDQFLHHRIQAGTNHSLCQKVQGGTGQPLYQERTTREKLLMQGMAQQLQQRTPHSSQGASKRDYSLTVEGDNASSVLLGCPILLNQEFQVHEHSNRGSLERDQNHKRRRVDSPCYTTIPSVHKVIRYTEDGLRQVETNASHIFVNQLEKGRGGAFSSSSINSCEKPNQNYMRGQPYMHSACAHRNVQRQDNLPEMSSIVEPMGDKRASKITTPLISLITARADSDVQCAPTSNRNRPCIDGQGTEAVYWTSPSIYSTKNKETESISKPLSKTPGSHELQKNPDSLNEIICRFQYLNLNHTDGEIIQHDEHAVIPYRGTGTMVPFEAFNPIKRRKPRPKVNLDPETSRKWNLLMGKEASNDDKDADKAKWWEEERKVFQGRADSFIARMHLVQGDRRFSRWKGSVVDSVIGVFLTQNVTDHLSSSAFMSLAARFPIKSTSKDITSRNDVPRIIVEEPEVITIDSDCEIGWHQKSSRPIYSRAPDESWDGRRCSPSLGNKASTFGEADTWRVEEVISSQDSTGSSTIEVAGKIHSCPGSHSRKYYATSGLETASNCSSTSFIHWELENIARCLDFIGQVPQSSLIDCLPKSGLGESRSMHEHMWSRNSINRPTSVYYPFDLNMPHTQAPIVHSNDYQFPLCDQSELSEVQSSLMLGNESIRFLSSNASTVSMGLHVDATSRGVGQGEPRKTANGRPWPQESPNGRDQAAYCQDSHSNHQHGGTAILQSVSKSDIEHSQRQIHEAQEVANVTNHGGWAYSNEKSMSVTGKEAHIENKSAEFISKEQLSSSTEAHSKAKIKMLKTKGAKIEIDKKMVFDWDGLRKQVYSNGIKRERTKDAMDSIDYEAVRSSDVNDISAAIKERGMNNMLADRIKAFLNRLVTDHGSIDLEWLKEVPPDKAKDYLLSIWGLGLKSVECVRLLTLHQHAFPVDTNVGRIAVRLGWVPLQPLPESLQLHLLELYPVLESIQKYLWPRLCTLDQRTLYELHYQLITFGKVFCTKSKPNCNACPLRGECRHFASAFTSARLALPGPEEKSIITSAVPVQPNQQPIINVNPVQLQLLEDKPPQEEVFEQKRWEPIVEEPTTPEPEIIEQSEIDIEDAFYDDPDEIPTIKLSAEDITSLTNYIKENLEIQEGDMSKSLVALNPEAAYIPAPKLKNISRLRTEHQVYELPDTHPLLKELDKREPDDPSPYLLAIWTPGETANSIVPPEGACSSTDSGKLCTENACFSCNNKRETNSQTVRGTILIPCRTAMRGSFPLNGTYFQVNEVFADHDSSLKPIDVPREFIWNLPRRTVYFGTTVSTIFKGMSTEEIQYCFWRGFVCVRGFDRLTRAPRPLMARLHFPASRWKGGRSTTNNKFNRGTTDNQ